MQNIYAIILAGGKGLRLQEDYPKQFLMLKNRPIIAWSLEKFNKLSEIDEIIAVLLIIIINIIKLLKLIRRAYIINIILI